MASVKGVLVGLGIGKCVCVWGGGGGGNFSVIKKKEKKKKWLCWGEET